MKKLALFLSMLLLFTALCGCKEKDKGNSSVVSSEASKTELPTITDDVSLDPQSGEIGRPLGETVNITEVKPKQGVHNGIDVSKWQGKIDWEKVKSSGIDFAVIRIGFRGENGKIYKDEYADYNIQQADKADVLVGVYFFSTAVNTAEAKQEADWVRENIKNYPISLPVVYDCEGFNNGESRMYSLTHAQRTDNALSFINAIKGYGYEAMFYASKNDLQGSFDTERIEDAAKIWIAHFDGKVYPEAQNPQYSGKYSMWQYTNKGVVSGVSTDVDLVVSYEKFSKKTPKEQGTVNEATAPKPVDNTYKAVNDRVTAKYQVNLREAATSTSAQVGVLNAGEYLDRTAVGSNGWSKLLFNGKTVYAVSSYLTNEENYQKPVASEPVNDGYTVVNDKVTPLEKVNLRREPTTDSEQVAEIKNGTVLERIAINKDKGWSRISYNGETLYAASRYLTTDLNYNPSNGSTPSDVSTEMLFYKTSQQVTPKIEVSLRSAPVGGDKSQVVYSLKNGEYVERTGYSDQGWSRVIWNGQTLYAVTSYLEPEP